MRRPSPRKLYSVLITRSGLAGLQRQRRRRRVVIAAYHTIASDDLARQLAFLSQTYRVIPLADVVAGLQGKQALPDYALAITFDDGYASTCKDAFPILTRLHLPATIFLTTGFAGQGLLWYDAISAAIENGADLEDILPAHLRGVQRTRQRRAILDYLKGAPDNERMRLVGLVQERTTWSDEQKQRFGLLSWDMAREMQASGLIRFGGHTVTHPLLARSGQEKTRAEVFGCAADLQRELGPATRHFAYPNGQAADFNGATEDIVREAGFACACSSIWGICGRGDDLYALRRISLDGSFNLDELAAAPFWPQGRVK